MSWNIGAAIVSIICFLTGSYVLKIESIGKRVTYIFSIPFLLSVILYWGVSVAEGVSSQTGGWFMIAVLPWAGLGLSSLLVGMLVAAVFKKSRASS